MPRLTKRLRSKSAASSRLFVSVNLPGSPGPFTEDVLRVRRVDTFSGASPRSAAKLSEYRRQLFMGPPVTREAAKKMDDSSSANTSGTQASAQDLDDHDIAPLHGDPEDDLRQEQQDVTPRRNPSRAQQQRQPERPEIENVLTQLTQEILTMRREVAANQTQQAQLADVPEDPNFDCVLLKLPAETKFPVPGTGIAQRIAADLLARLPTLAARDQHDARFVLAVISDWDDLDDEMRNIAFQSLNIYTIVATYGWPTAIASSSAVRQPHQTTYYHLVLYPYRINGQTTTTYKEGDDTAINNDNRRQHQQPPQHNLEHRLLPEVDAEIDCLYFHLIFHQVPLLWVHVVGPYLTWGVFVLVFYPKNLRGFDQVLVTLNLFVPSPSNLLNSC